MNKVWFETVPVFVTRKTADDFIYHIDIPVWMTLLIALIVLINIFLWGGIGIYEAIKMIA